MSRESNLCHSSPEHRQKVLSKERHNGHYRYLLILFPCNYELHLILDLYFARCIFNLSLLYHYSFKDVLRNVTCCIPNTIEFLQKHGALQSTVLCPGPCVKGSRSFGCGRNMCLKKTKDGKDVMMWRCRRLHKVTKGNQTFVTKDVKLTIRHMSWLVDTKIILPTVVELMYLWSQGFTVAQIIHELKISRCSAVEWTLFFRECCFMKMIEDSEQMGPGIEVEIDESIFGKRKYYRGHRVEGQWIFGSHEKYDKKKVFMMCTLIPLIKKWIKQGSVIHSDCWKAYCKLPSLGYTHVTVNHSKEFLNEENAACTNGIESDWRHAKVSMP